jgi:hypothetical protein
MKSNTIKEFTPEPIRFQDDVRHRTGYFSHVETWYYDAVFENGYSMVSLVNVIHIGRIGTVLSGIFIYKNGNLIKSIRKRYPLRSFYGSEKTLLLKLNKKEVVKGRIEADDIWLYRINRGDKNIGFDLQFIKTYKPFKGRTYLGKWLVIPGFSVSGNLYLDGEKIFVKGEGYHDHNIYSLKAPFITKGYFFGKIPLKNANVIWAQIKKSKHDIEKLVILVKKDTYKSISPENFQFSIDKERKDHRKMIPYQGFIKVEDSDLKLDVSFKPKAFHYIGILAAHYWRFHEIYTGSYTLKSEPVNISEIDVAEYLKFF